MTALPADVWPWLALAGLGLFHGLNPAMGWLFAVALGMHRNSERVVLLSLVPIAAGHAAAITAVVFVVLALGLMIGHADLGKPAGLILIGWALWHAAYGHRRKVRVGMQAGLFGLFLWSFLMASAHGAGLMLVPFVLPLCLTAPTGQEPTALGAMPIALAAVAVHTAAMLATIGVVSLFVYHWIGTAFLRRGWINLDLVWMLALIACGTVLLLT
jgi:hypothetical protein